MKFILIKSCPNGSTVNIHLESEVELRKHLEAMWRVTPGYSVIAVVSAPDTSDAGNKPQRQDALDDQLRDLIPLATKAVLRCSRLPS